MEFLSFVVKVLRVNNSVWMYVFVTVQWVLQKAVQLSVRFLKSVVSFMKPVVVKAEHLSLYFWHCTFTACNVLGSMFAACVLFALQAGLVHVLFSVAFFSSPLDTTTALLSDFAEISQGTLFIGLEKVDWGNMDWFSLFQDSSDTRHHWMRFAARCANGVYELVLVDRDFNTSPFKTHMPDAWFVDEERTQFSPLFSDASGEEVPREPTPQKGLKMEKEDVEYTKNLLVLSLFFVAAVMARVCA
jgi:hypothetical protein